MQGRAGLSFPLGQTSVYTACLLLSYKPAQSSSPEVAHQAALRSVVGSGLQGDGSEQKVLARWGLFSF